MPSTRFYCAICGAGLDVDESVAGQVAECPGCRHVVPVPGRLTSVLGGPARATVAQAVLPKGVLALEVKFLCIQCDAKLRIDARLEGELVNCPRCSAQMRVPQWSAAPAIAPPGRVSHTAELSEAEIEYLSGPHDFRGMHAAAR